MKQDERIPQFSAFHLLVYHVFRALEALEQELYTRRYVDAYQREPTYSRRYGAHQAVQHFMDLSSPLVKRWSEQEIRDWLSQKCTEWNQTLQWQRDVAQNPHAKGRNEIAQYQAEGCIPLYEEWLPVFAWICSADRAAFAQHAHWRARFVRPRPTEAERQRAVQLDVVARAVYVEAHSYVLARVERSDTLNASEYGTYHGLSIIRNYLFDWEHTVPMLDAFQRRVQGLLDAYHRHLESCQEQLDSYEQDVARWEKDGWNNYYRGPGERPTEAERVTFRAWYRREYGPEKQRAEMESMCKPLERLRAALLASTEESQHTQHKGGPL